MTGVAPALSPYTTVPPLFPGQTIVCLGSGPSLTEADVAVCRFRASVIAVNDTYRIAPWADVLYAADMQWWKWQRDVPDAAMPLLKYTVSPRAVQFRPSLRVVRWDGQAGLSTDPAAIRLGGHSGYQAINLAVLFGARKIILLGYDMQPSADGRHHFFGEHPAGQHPHYQHRLGAFASLVDPLQQLGIPLINATRRTAITVFPQQPIEEALA